MNPVGLVVNPSASRDVRRLTSLAQNIDVHTRVNVVARILCGLAAGGADKVLFMAERCRVVERACRQLASFDSPLAGRVALLTRPLPMPGEANDAAGTGMAAAALAEAGAACVLTVGGDGTNRAVVRGWTRAVMVPLPGGTNNACATPIDPTAAGMAAAVFSRDPDGHARHLRRMPRLDVVAGDRPADLALVDAVSLRAGWIGARAIWDPAVLVEAVLTRADPALTGLAGLGGMLAPLEADAGRALYVRFGSEGSIRVLAPLGPGQLQVVGVRDWRTIESDIDVCMGTGPLAVALDGEREIVLRRDEPVTVRLNPDGPFVLDAAGLLRTVAGQGAFTRRK